MAISVQGGGKGAVLHFCKRGQKMGVRTAIEVSPVRVWGKRGAETPQSRLRGVFRERPGRFCISA